MFRGKKTNVFTITGGRDSKFKGGKNTELKKRKGQSELKVKDRKLGLENGRERGERWRPQPDATHTDTHNTTQESR